MNVLRTMLLVALLGIPAGGLAQTPAVGLKGGLNMASFGGLRIIDAEYKAGASLGAFITVPVSATLAVQPEVLFSRKGAGYAAYDYSDMPADGDAPPIGVYISEKTSHDYLEIPVLLKLIPRSQSSNVQPILFAGPSVGFLLGVKDVYGIDYKEHLNSADLGLIFGGGVEYGKISFEGRYNLGLTSVARDYDASFGRVAGDIRNRAFTVLLGIRLF
jgi:hypothetical protein